MNRSKRPMTNKLRKKMEKTIRNAQGAYPVPETYEYSDRLTTQEMLKKYPKKVAKKQQELLVAAEKRMEIKAKRPKHIPSKRTTPGEVMERDAAPANVHVEGKRWIKTLTKQNLAQRAIQSHKGGRKK